MEYDEVRNKVSRSGTDLVELQAALKQLQGRVDRHSLAIQVLKEMLLSQGGFDEDQFAERLQLAAARKKASGKACHKCGKPMSSKHNRCMYCGEQRQPEI